MNGLIRILNTMLWCWLALSNVLTPVNGDANVWWERAKQFCQLGPISDVSWLLGHAIIPFALWLFFDWMIRNATRKEKSDHPPTIP